MQDFSRVRPGVQTTAAGLRFDCDGAAKLGDATVTPYVDVTYARNRVDAYTEAGVVFLRVSMSERKRTPSCVLVQMSHFRSNQK